MSDYPMLISNKLHSFRNFWLRKYEVFRLFFGYEGIIFQFSCGIVGGYPEENIYLHCFS